MYTSIRLQNYRSYEDFVVELSSAVNIVVGPNASGKTNLLEAIYVLNMGSSFRAGDEALISNNSDWARIDGQRKDTKMSVLFSKKDGKLSKEIEIDGIKKRRFMPNHKQPTTIFEPEHLRFLIGSPELRRSYLDDVIAQNDSQYRNSLSQYRRVLSQRNRLLKKQPQGWRDQLFVWDLKLSEYGEYIVDSRQKLIKRINEDIEEIYSKLSAKKTTLLIDYLSSVDDFGDYRSTMLEGLEKNLERDMLRGSTSIGPHRDDIETTLNGAKASISASRGESRTIVLALKVIELRLLEEENDQKPLLLLDDVFSELDGARRRALTSYLSNYQTIITTTDADAIIKYFLGEHKIIPMG